MLERAVAFLKADKDQALDLFTSGNGGFTDGDGEQTMFGPGDSFFVAQGETLTWEIHEAVQKTFLIHVDVGS